MGLEAMLRDAPTTRGGKGPGASSRASSPCQQLTNATAALRVEVTCSTWGSVGPECSFVARMPMLQGRNVVLESKYGSPKIVNDGVTIAREVS